MRQNPGSQQDLTSPTLSTKVSALPVPSSGVLSMSFSRFACMDLLVRSTASFSMLKTSSGWLVTCLFLVLSTALLQGTAYAQEATVNAQLSASTITRDESVVLTITATGIDAELDASSLEGDFDVVGRSSSRQISTIIGSDSRARNTSIVTWTLELLPKGQGVFTIPAVKVGDLETQLLTLTVNEVPQGAQRDVFLEATVDNSTPWVQAQVVMTLRVFQAVDIVDGGLDTPSAENLQVERIGEDTRKTELRDGRQYSVTERRFALFPQKSGEITIDPVTLSVSVPAEPDRVRGFFSPTRKLTRRSDPITLNVQSRPDSGAVWWLPAQQLTLTSQWQGDPASAQVDLPLTRTLVMRAQGVLESQLPRISIPAVDGLSLYAEDPQLAMGADASGLVAEQRINWALIPQRSGELTLPAISVEWFNTLSGQTEVVELPAETIDVAPSVNASAPTNEMSGSDSLAALDRSARAGNNTATGGVSSLQGVDETQVSQVQSNDNSMIDLSVAQNAALTSGATADALQRIGALETSLDRWRIAALAVLGLWLISMTWFWMRRRGRHAATTAIDSDERGASRASGMLTTRRRQGAGRLDAFHRQFVPLSQLERACQNGDLPQVKQALLDWASRQWSVNSPSTLDDLQQRLPESSARKLIGQLQMALYGRADTEHAASSAVESFTELPDALKRAMQESGGIPAVSDAANDGHLAGKASSSLPPL